MVLVSVTAYSVVPLLKSNDTEAAVVPLKLPRAVALRMYEPEELVAPSPWTLAPPGPITAEPEVML